MQPNDFWAALAVMPLVGVAFAVLTVKLIEYRNGMIKLREDIYGRRAKALGYDPDEVWVMGEMWAMVGVCEDEAREAAKRYAEGSQ